MSFRRILRFQEFTAANCCLLEGKHCWLSRRKWLPPSPFPVTRWWLQMLTPNWSPHSHPTAQKVCVCYSPVSKMRVLVPGREEQLLLSISRKELCLQLIQLLVICPAAPRFGFGVYNTRGQKKGPTVQPASVYLIPYQAQLRTLCDAKEWEKHNTDSEGDIKVSSISVQVGDTQRTSITPFFMLGQT